MADLTNIDQASPALTGLPSTIAAPTASKPTMTWQQILAAIASLSGGSSQQNNITGLTQGLSSNVNRGIPLYTPPLQALPMQDDQQKQTSAGDIAQYAAIIAQLFGASGATAALDKGALSAGIGSGSSSNVGAF